jgi:methylmalonyl-CoA/ethylmalonyl-CoA epimerase
MIRRLDHVAVVVASTERALDHFSARLGLPVVSSEELDEPHVRLTYLTAGNAFLQLVEPLSDTGTVADFLHRHGEGLHHICFGADDPIGDATAVGDGTPATGGQGRGRVSAFVPGLPPHGVRVECTAFDADEDVRRSPHALGQSAADTNAR